MFSCCFSEFSLNVKTLVSRNTVLVVKSTGNILMYCIFSIDLASVAMYIISVYDLLF